MKSLAGRRVLVTGGEGFVGSNVVHACVARGATVTSLDARVKGTGCDPHNLNGLAVERRHIDIRDRDALAAALPGHDLVVHCAASTSHRRSMLEPHTSLAINGEGTLNLLEAMRTHAPDARLVHVGTTTQLGPHRVQPADEEHPQAPIDLYSTHKMLAERYVLIYARAHGIRGTVVRLPNLFGPRICLTDPGLSFIGWFIGLGMRGEAMTVYRPGTQQRSFLHIDDAVDALLRAADVPETVGRALTIAHDQHRSVLDAARAVAEHIGGRVSLVDWPADRKAIEVGDVLLDTCRSRAALGWAPRFDLDTGMARTARWYRDRGTS